MSELMNSFVNGTSGLPCSASLPVRPYLTGTTSPSRVRRCTGGEDSKAIGIVKRGVLTAGIAVAVAQNYGFQFLGQVSTTVSQGDKLSIKDGSAFKAAYLTAGLRFCAVALQSRTNAGQCWLMWVPGGVV